MCKCRRDMRWNTKALECQVFLSKAPESMSMREILAYINSFFKESGVFDRDVVIDASRKGNKGLCVFEQTGNGRMSLRLIRACQLKSCTSGAQQGVFRR